MPPSAYTYDAADRLTSITHTYLDPSNVQQQLYIGYTYDNAGNRLTMSDNRANPAGTTTYTYDSLDRLTSATDPASALASYGYDAAGNRTTITKGGTTVTSTYDALNRLLSDTSGTTYTYDANGNQLTKTAGGVTTTYTYDALDRMTGLSGGPHSAVYTSNGDGLRMSKAVDGGPAVYQTWASLGQPQVIRDGTTDYLWSSEVIAQVPTGGTAQYAHGDGLGSMRQITDTTGHVVGSQQYDAYGAPQQQTGAQAAPVPGWSVGFTGQQMDAESGLVYLRARYYSPDSGRLMSQDAVGAPGNYIYANNNPTRFVDPSGHSPSEGVGGVTEAALASGVCTSEGGCDVVRLRAMQRAFGEANLGYVSVQVAYREVKFDGIGTEFGHLVIVLKVGLAIVIEVDYEGRNRGGHLEAEVSFEGVEYVENDTFTLCNGSCPEDTFETIERSVREVNREPRIPYNPFPFILFGANSNSFAYYVIDNLGLYLAKRPEKDYFKRTNLTFPGWGPYIKERYNR